MYIHRHNLVKHIESQCKNKESFLKETGLSNEEYHYLLHGKKLSVSIAYKVYRYAEKENVRHLFFLKRTFPVRNEIKNVSSEVRL